MVTNEYKHFIFSQLKFATQLYMIDNSGYLLDFKSLSPDYEDCLKMDIDPYLKSENCHEVMEFFEACSELIIALAR